jgi:hypothetical protein
MRETLTISLPGKTKRLIERAASESGLTTSEYVRLAIFRKLWLDAATESRRIGVARAARKHPVLLDKKTEPKTRELSPERVESVAAPVPEKPSLVQPLAPCRYNRGYG